MSLSLFHPANSIASQKRRMISLHLFNSIHPPGPGLGPGLETSRNMIGSRTMEQQTDDNLKRRLDSQSRAIAESLATMLWVVFVSGKPADRLLAAYLRDRRELGSRDRRVISEIVYGCFRWWGWTQKVLPGSFIEALVKAPRNTHDAGQTDRTILPEEQRFGKNWQDWCRVLYATSVLEQRPADQLTAYWAELLRMQESETNPTVVMSKLAHHQGENYEWKREDLIPAWVGSQLSKDVEPGQLSDWLQKRPPLWLRIQSPDRPSVLSELTSLELLPAAHAKVADAVKIDANRQNLYTLPVYKEGRVEIQDLASQAVGLVCAPKPGERWWDACAGGGGKTLLLAQLMRSKGTIVATDIRSFVLDELKLRARRAGFSNITTREWKGKPLPKDKATFDGILVDAPCSGSGTWRRNPAARWCIEPADITRLVTLQTQLLTNAAASLKPGGTLIYSTCSIFECENRAVAAAFAAAMPEFVLTPFMNPITGAETDGMLQIRPWDGDCDGMFVAKFVRSRK